MAWHAAQPLTSVPSTAFRAAKPAPARSEPWRVMSDDRGEIDEFTLMAARRGDSAALTALVECYDGRLRRLAFHLLRDGDDLDDVLQEVYLRAFRGLPRFRGKSSLSTWLYRITYNCCAARSSRRSRESLLAWQPEVHDLSGADPSSDPHESLAPAEAVKALLQGLPQEQLAAVLLVDLCGLSVRKAAELLKAPPSTVASRLRVARDRIRERSGQTPSSSTTTSESGR